MTFAMAINIAVFGLHMTRYSLYMTVLVIDMAIFDPNMTGFFQKFQSFFFLQN